MNEKRMDRIEAKINPRGPCYRVDWENGEENKCPHNHDLEPSAEDCDRCPHASEWHMIKVELVGPD
jgi:hypothetical protein